MWLLKTDAGADPACVFRIVPGNAKTIGRATGADFIVDANLVSRVHCRVAAGATGLEVIDLDSTNGTFVNGERVVDRAPLKDGDRLGVGRVELVVSRAHSAS
jgi:pSer/pThr/pTyr-binding forkhead associated (FHA) protein